jgi:hypothetical protein
MPKKPLIFDAVSVAVFVLERENGHGIGNKTPKKRTILWTIYRFFLPSEG